MDQMLIIAGGVALGGLALIYRKPIAIGLLVLTSLAIVVALGLWAANTFTERVIQHLVATGWPDARVNQHGIWRLIALLTSMSVVWFVLNLGPEILQIPAVRQQ